MERRQKILAFTYGESHLFTPFADSSLQRLICMYTKAKSGPLLFTLIKKRHDSWLLNQTSGKLDQIVHRVLICCDTSLNWNFLQFFSWLVTGPTRLPFVWFHSNLFSIVPKLDWTDFYQMLSFFMLAWRGRRLPMKKKTKLNDLDDFVFQPERPDEPSIIVHPLIESFLLDCFGKDNTYVTMSSTDRACDGLSRRKVR